MAKIKSPLNDNHLAALNEIIRQCHETAKMCDQCEACNLDMQPEREKNADQLDTAMKIKKAFFPNAK